jgi:hypothetical protein
MQPMVDTIFNFINFAARIGLVIYIIRKYVVRLVSNAITYEQESFKLLESKYQDIKIHSHQIEKNIEEQEQLYFDLQKKFVIWKSSIEQQQAQYEKKCSEREKIARLLFEKKQENIQRKFLLQQELPNVLAQVQNDIQVQINKDQQLGKNYIQNIMTHLSKE